MLERKLATNKRLSKVNELMTKRADHSIEGATDEILKSEK